jgi:hypothetical protein
MEGLYFYLTCAFEAASGFELLLERGNERKIPPVPQTKKS